MSQVTGITPSGEMFSMQTATSAPEWPLHSTALLQPICLPAGQPGFQAYTGPRYSSDGADMALA